MRPKRKQAEYTYTEDDGYRFKYFMVRKVNKEYDPPFSLL